MPVRYSLQPDPLHGTGTFHPHVVPGMVLSEEDLVERMVQGGTTLGRAELRAAMILMMETIALVLEEGHHVNLPICRLRPTVRGAFTSRDEIFRKGRQQVSATASAGAWLKKRLSWASVERVPEGRGIDRPRPGVFRDEATGSSQGMATPGGIGEIMGRRLKFDPAGEGEGVFFRQILPGGGLAAEVRATAVGVRTDSRLVFVIPPLPPGSYRCVVRRRFGRSGSLLREGLLQPDLTVP